MLDRYGLSARIRMHGRALRASDLIMYDIDRFPGLARDDLNTQAIFSGLAGTVSKSLASFFLKGMDGVSGSSSSRAYPFEL